MLQYTDLRKWRLGHLSIYKTVAYGNHRVLNQHTKNKLSLRWDRDVNSFWKLHVEDIKNHVFEKKPNNSNIWKHMSLIFLTDQGDIFSNRMLMRNFAHVCPIARMTYVKIALFFIFFVNKSIQSEIIAGWTPSWLSILLFGSSKIHKNCVNSEKHT